MQRLPSCMVQLLTGTLDTMAKDLLTTSTRTVISFVGLSHPVLLDNMI